MQQVRCEFDVADEVAGGDVDACRFSHRHAGCPGVRVVEESVAVGSWRGQFDASDAFHRSQSDTFGLDGLHRLAASGAGVRSRQRQGAGAVLVDQCGRCGDKFGDVGESFEQTVAQRLSDEQVLLAVDRCEQDA